MSHGRSAFRDNVEVARSPNERCARDQRSPGSITAALELLSPSPPDVENRNQDDRRGPDVRLGFAPGEEIEPAEPYFVKEENK